MILRKYALVALQSSVPYGACSALTRNFVTEDDPEHLQLGWRTGQSYSQDLRDRVLGAVDGRMAVRAAAATFGVSIAYILQGVDAAAFDRRCRYQLEPRS